MELPESPSSPQPDPPDGSSKHPGRPDPPRDAVPDWIPRRVSGNDLPLSYSQQRLWFVDQVHQGSLEFNRTLALRLSGPLDVEALRHSLNAIVRRHAVLRTSFPAVSGLPVQRVNPPEPLKIPLFDLRRFPASERQPEAVRLARQMTSRPFDLTHDLPVRMGIIRLDLDAHVFVLTAHHIVFDGTSESIFIRELSELYTAAHAGVESRLVEPAIQYGDYAAWERQQVRQAGPDPHLAYWNRKLSNLSPRPGLPTVDEETHLAGAAAGREGNGLSAILSETVRSFCRQEEATPFMLFASAFILLLHRLSCSDDIVIGFPVAGRNRLEFENLIGMFVNTLPLRADLSDAPTFRELLSRVRRATVEALGHQETPFERLVEVVQPERSLARPPIFDCLINSHVFHRQELPFGDLNVEVFPLPEVSAAYPLTLYLFTESDGFRLELSYQSAKFSQRQVRRLLSQLAFILEQGLDDPDRSIDEYSLVEPSSLAIIPDPSAPIEETDYPNVLTMISEWVDRFPAARAVVSTGGSSSYAELWNGSTRLASRLITAGIQPGQAVAIVARRSLELVASMLGVMMTGGVILLIDPDWPRARVEAMLARGQAMHLIMSQGWAPETLWLKEAPGLIAHALAPGPVSAPGDRLDDFPSPDWATPFPSDPAYIFFTSGTTGDPEAVLGCHKGLSHFLTWQRQTFGVGPGDRCSLLTGLSFDPILREIFLPLTSGGTICIPGQEINAASERIVPWIVKEKITIVHSVPSLVRSWLSRRRLRKVPADLRWLFLAGEPLGDDLVRRLRSSLTSEAKIVNLYGPTETTLVKSFFVVPEPPSPGIQPLGSPLPQTQLLVLGTDDRMCGIGEPGEIVIRSPYRTLGYLSPDSPRNASFVPNKYTSEPDDLLYRTGDRGYYRSDGMLGFLGRIDQQVKIHGTRVEPEGVAAVLSRQPGVLACAVLSSKDEGGTDRLTAYLEVQDRSRTVDEFREGIAEELPGAMIPSSFVLVDRLPLTLNGKVDRDALRRLEATSVSTRTDFVPARDRLERKLVRIWEDVLDTRPIGVQDDFFAKGGHSLLAVRMFVEVERVTKKRLPVRVIFEAPTIERLAALIRRDNWAPPDTQLVSIRSDGTRPPVFWVHAAGGHVLSYRRLADYLSPDQPVYALQGVNLEEDRLGEADVDEMATRYIVDLQKVRPSGPYFVGGLSFGGLVAWEIAQRLVAQGHAVPLLVLLDTRGPRYPKPSFLQSLVLELRQRIEFHGGNISVLPPSQKLAYLFERGKTLLPRLAHRGLTAIQTTWFLTTSPAPRAVKRAYRGDIRARARYTPKPYTGRIAFFRAQSQPSGRGYPLMGWEGLVQGRMDIYEVPGAHVSIMAEPHLKVLASKLTECLESAQPAAVRHSQESE